MVTGRRKRQAPPGPPSLPGPAALLTMAWQHLDDEHAHGRPLWIRRCWVSGDRASEFMTFELGPDLRMRIYNATTGRLLAESPPNRGRRPKPARKVWRA